MSKRIAVKIDSIYNFYNFKKPLQSTGGGFLFGYEYNLSPHKDKFPFLQNYYGNHYTANCIDNYFCNLFGGLSFPVVVSNDYEIDNNNLNFLYNTALEQFGEKSRSAMLANEYKYNELLKTINYDYNPINNYDMEESGTDTNTIGERHTTNTIGDRTDVIGERTDTIGERTDVIGKGTTTTTMVDERETTTQNQNYVVGYNDQNKRLESESITKTAFDVQGSHGNDTTTTQEENERQNKQGSQTTTQGSQTTTIGGSTNDSLTQSTIDTMTHSFSRHGNIGVMSTQDLINQQRNIVDFNFMSIIYNDVMSALCLDLWDLEEGEEI